MELSKEQLLQIDNYIFVCGIKYYDVRTEIVDHFANILELKLDEDPTLDFKKEIKNIHRNFSDSGFSKLLKEKTKSVQKRFYKQSLKHFITFFKLPKIIISGVLFYILFKVMSFVDSKEIFFSILASVLIFSYLIEVIYLFIIKKKKREKFLVLDKSTHFNLFIMNFGQLFHFGTTLRNEESFLNPVHNSIQLGIFVLVLLFFWSGEYVYRENKKLVKQQYPNILV